MNNKFLSLTLIGFSFAVLTTFSGCKKGGLNIFTIEDDKAFGAQMETEIAGNPTEYPLVSESAYPAAYAYLNGLKNEILAGGKIEHANDFVWKLYIVKDDAVQNAFCTPGGYIYVYTGLIKYLNNASSLAGVLGHEMAHADKRHSTEQMTKQYGLELLVAVVAGTTNQTQLAQMAASLSSLAFSRSDEKEADEFSVTYLCPTRYRADGAADFFQKLDADGVSCNGVQAFFSTHPCPDNRIANIQSNAASQNCTTGDIGTTDDVNNYTAFKASLPQ